MLDLFLQLRRASLRGAHADCDAEMMLVGIALIAMGLALL